MIIKTDFETLDSVMVTNSAIVSDKMLQEDLKNVVVWVKNGEIRFAAYSGAICNATEVDAEVELTEEEKQQDEIFAQLRAKDINDILGSFKGLQRTKVSKIEIHIEENEAIMHVFEEPVDLEDPNADKYYQESKFRVTKPPIKKIVMSEIHNINIDVEGTEMPSGDLLLYISTLYPTVQKETRESTNNILFGTDHIYSVLAPYSATMKNKLPDVISGFRLQNTVVNFLQNFISREETFTIDKQTNENGMVILTIKVGGSVATIKCADMSRAFDITNFVTTPPNGVVVDKAYLIDVLKRMKLSSDAALVEINIENGEGTMEVVSKNMKQNIPVVTAKGEGNFPFTIRAELLSNIIFSHTQIFGEHVYLYLETNDKGNIVLAVKDNTDIWQTKMTGLAPAKGSFAWN